jgi:hypothetical protein
VLEEELRHEIHALRGEEVALPMQYEVLRLLNLHHMVFHAVARGAGEGRSASLCVWLVAAADKRSAVARLYKHGGLAFSPIRVSPLNLFNKHGICKLCLSQVKSSNLFKCREAKPRAPLKMDPYNSLRA